MAKTVEPGTTQIELTLSARGWKVGDEVVIASTSKSMRENEAVRIVSVTSDMKTLTITPALKYKHVSISQTIAGRLIETRAEVGLLSRNVKVCFLFHTYLKVS